MAESRWQKIKRWWIASDPDDLAREEFRLAAERRQMVTSANRLASTVVLEEQQEASARYVDRRDPS